MSIEERIFERYGVRKGDKLFNSLALLEVHNPDIPEPVKTPEPEVEYELVARVDGEQVYRKSWPLLDVVLQSANSAERHVRKELSRLRRESTKAETNG